jgi:uncharacterized membrane protein
MPRKVTVAQLRKRAAKAKIKGRTKMNRAQLERALSNDGNKELQAITRQNTGRPINRRRQMSEEYQGYVNYSAWWIALQMSNDYDLYTFFKGFEQSGLLKSARDLRNAWEQYLDMSDIDSNDPELILFEDMAKALLRTVTYDGWEQILEGFLEE